MIAAGTVPTGPRVVTSRFDVADGHTYDGYVRTGGYAALRRAVTSMTPAQVHDEVKAAELQGRGGAGFPAGAKWGFLPADVHPRYLVVNGDESEPGTYKDRLLMERDPHQLVEGIVLACYALGAAQAFLYVRGEMALAQERLAAAINDAYAHGMVGRRICGTDFSVDVTLTWGAGAYIVGEETALIESLEGERGMPRLKPPFFPAVKGLYMQPTIVNNVETLSNLPYIVGEGGATFKQHGAATSSGMRMFAVSGHVERPGVFEVPNGTTTFRMLFEAPEYCGGVRAGGRVKAFIPGGASAMWFFEEHLDLPLDAYLPEDVAEANAQLDEARAIGDSYKEAEDSDEELPTLGPGTEVVVAAERGRAGARRAGCGRRFQARGHDSEYRRAADRGVRRHAAYRQQQSGSGADLRG